MLVKNAEALERLAAVDTLVVDKTGTLTEGQPALVGIETVPGGPGDDALLRVGRRARAGQRAPAGAPPSSRRRRAVGSSATLPRASSRSRARASQGAVAGQAVALGNAALLAELELEPGRPAGGHASRRAGGRRDGRLHGRRGQVAGLLAIADPLKAGAREALDALRAEGVEIVMATGDNRRTAEAVASQLGIERVEAEVLPEAKGEVIARLKGEGRVVAMAGDGVNDAPGLAVADVGIAMGTGADVAMESAGVTLVKGDLAGIVRARRLSRAVLANIRQNLVLAFGYNTLAVPIAAGALYPFTGMLLSPIIAAAAMSLSSVSVIGNALRLRQVRF